jgi:peptide/nickel transport system substrate-binding protein
MKGLIMAERNATMRLRRELVAAVCVTTAWLRRARATAALAAAALVAATLLGGPATAQPATPHKGGTLVVALDGSGLGTLNTQMTSATSALTVADIWADGLFARDAKGQKVPHLATSWDVSPDLKTYTFHLRSDVKWSDGEPFSSADVAFTLLEVAKFNTYQTQTLANVASVETPDAATFVVHTKAPLAVMLDAFDKEVFPLMAKHVYEHTDITLNPANRNPVGLGPFKLQSWEQGRALTFVRNPYFWDSPKPYLDSVVVAIIPDMQQETNALLRGEIDFMKLPYTQLKRIQDAAADGKVIAHKVELSAPERSSLDLNTARKPFDDVRVRQALLIAMDRSRIVSDAYHGFAIEAGNAIPEQFTDLTDPSIKYSELYAHDPAKAAKLLDEAGYPLVNGKRFAMELTYASADFNRVIMEPMAQILAAQWGAIGIDVKLAGLDIQLWIDKVYNHRDFDASLVSLTGRTDPMLGVDRSFLCNTTHLPYVNPTSYCNPALDAVAAKANTAAATDRRQYYKTYIEIVAHDLNEITLTNVSTYYGVSTRFEDLQKQFDISFNEYPNWAEVWLKSGQ